MCIVLKTHTHTGHLLSAVRPVFELINRPQWSAWDGDIKKKKKCEHRVCIRERHSLQVWKVNGGKLLNMHFLYCQTDGITFVFCIVFIYKSYFCLFHIFWHIWLLVVDVGLLMPWQCVYDFSLLIKDLDQFLWRLLNIFSQVWLKQKTAKCVAMTFVLSWSLQNNV